MEKAGVDRNEEETNGWPDFRNIRDLFLSRWELRDVRVRIDTREGSRQLGKVAFERLRMTATSATGRKYGRKETNEEVVRRGVSTREISNCTRWMKQVFRGRESTDR